ncbi:hypothetical protein Q3H59_004228 [Pantoea sp. SORGH_AS 659]|nr:hypothetical protein [Pantoea sp. SORGH_AS_0659]
MSVAVEHPSEKTGHSLNHNNRNGDFMDIIKYLVEVNNNGIIQIEWGQSP